MAASRDVDASFLALPLSALTDAALRAGNTPDKTQIRDRTPAFVAEVRSGETALVLGAAGGVGSAAVQLVQPSGRACPIGWLTSSGQRLGTSGAGRPFMA